MARNIKTIYNSMVAAMNAETPLADLAPQADSAQDLLTDINSPSKVADHRLWMWFFAFFTWLVEVYVDAIIVGVKERTSINVGHSKWWVSKLKAFQYGFDLDVDDEKIVYADTTSGAAEAARIVKYAASVTNIDGRVLLKAAKDSAGEPTPLSPSELTSLQEYCNQIQISGVRKDVLSTVADLFMINAEVRYNPLVIASDGSLILDGATFPVHDAIVGYLKDLDFNENGQLSLTALKDRVQLVDGVEDFIISDALYQIGVSGWITINRLYNTQAGYIRVSTNSGETLNDTLTFTAGV